MEQTKKSKETKEVKKTNRPSKSYTLQSLANNLVKLHEMELLTDDQFMVMKKIKDQAVDKYIKDKFQ